MASIRDAISVGVADVEADWLAILHDPNASLATADKKLAASGLPLQVAGTWTPVLTFGGASTGITGTLSGQYIKIGSIVAVHCAIVLTSKGSAAGNTLISGLPYAPGYIAMLGCRWVNMASTLVNVTGYAQTNSTIAVLGATAATANLNSITDAAFSNTSQLIMSGIYLL